MEKGRGEGRESQLIMSNTYSFVRKVMTTFTFRSQSKYLSSGTNPLIKCMAYFFDLFFNYRRNCWLPCGVNSSFYVTYLGLALWSAD
jgi:hypothetical protein